MRHPLENIQKAIENGPFTVHLPIKNGLAAQTTPQIWGMESKKKQISIPCVLTVWMPQIFGYKLPKFWGINDQTKIGYKRAEYLLRYIYIYLEPRKRAKILLFQNYVVFFWNGTSSGCQHFSILRWLNWFFRNWQFTWVLLLQRTFWAPESATWFRLRPFVLPGIVNS